MCPRALNAGASTLVAPQRSTGVDVEEGKGSKSDGHPPPTLMRSAGHTVNEQPDSPQARGTWRDKALTLGIAPRRGKPRWLILVAMSDSVWGSCPRPSRWPDRSVTPVASRTTTATSSSTATVRLEQLRSDHLDRNRAQSPIDQDRQGWPFLGLEDAQAANGDTAFAGGTKQDDNCATVSDRKAPNKDDLKRIYVSSKTSRQDVSEPRLGPHPAEHDLGLGPRRVRVQQGHERARAPGRRARHGRRATC